MPLQSGVHPIYIPYVGTAKCMAYPSDQQDIVCQSSIFSVLGFWQFPKTNLRAYNILVAEITYAVTHVSHS